MPRCFFSCASFFAAAVDDLVRPGEQLLIHDLQLLYKLRSGRLGDQIPGVALVADHPPDVHRLKPGPLPGAQAAVVQHPGHRVAAGSFVGHFFKDFAHPGGFIRVDLQVLHRLVALVYPALIDSPVSIRHEPTGKMPAGHDLPNAVAGADRGFLAFSCRLPKADVVHQLIAVALDPLLALVDAPHLDAMLDKPFQHRTGSRFRCAPAGQTYRPAGCQSCRCPPPAAAPGSHPACWRTPWSRRFLSLPSPSPPASPAAGRTCGT